MRTNNLSLENCYEQLERVIKTCIVTMIEVRAIYCEVSMNERCLSETDTEQEQRLRYSEKQVVYMSARYDNDVIHNRVL